MSRTAATILLLLLATSIGTVQAGGIGTIQIPIRWCALEGTSAAENPDCGCKDSTKGVLWSRHERTSEAVFIPDCNVTWRSGAMMQQPGFPVIADPCDPASDGSCPGQTGDVFLVEGSGNLDELNAAFVACYSAWDAMGVGSVGVIGLNVRRYVNADGTTNLNAGFAGIPTFSSNASQLTEGAFSVIDNDFTWDPVGCTPPGSCESQIAMLDGDPTDQVMGHEGGHSISLNHTTPPPGTLMNDTAPVFDFLTTGGPGQNSQVCPNPVPTPTSQCGRIRLQALCHVPGAIVSVPFRGPVGSQLVADELPLTIGDVAADEVDLALVGLIDDPVASKASFVWRTAGEFPDLAFDLSYVFAIDRDDDSGTGGMPSTLGFPLTLQGAELVGEVMVMVFRPTPGGPKQFDTIQRLWEYDGTTFERVDDLTSEAADLEGVIDRLPPQGPGLAIFGGRVSHEFDRAFLAGASIVRFQAAARNLITVDVDRTPEGTLFLIAPQLPVCQLAPSVASPGQEVTLTASGLTPNQNTVIYFGADTVATGTTDAGGVAHTTFDVPALATAGDHLVTLGAQDPGDAITADCTLTVADVSNPGEPTDLRVDRNGQLNIRWNAPGAGCAGDDYAVYAGDLDVLRATGYDHVPRTCSTGGVSGYSTPPLPRNEYFLAVSTTSTEEGSYGRDSAGAERPSSAEACRRTRNEAACF